jgi:hypothetical protein
MGPNFLGLQKGLQRRDSKEGTQKGTQIFWDSGQESVKGRMGPMENI